MPRGQLNPVNVVVEKRQIGVPSSPQSLLAGAVAAATAAAATATVTATAATATATATTTATALSAAAIDDPGCAQSARCDNIYLLQRDSSVAPPGAACHAYERRAWDAWREHEGCREDMRSPHAPASRGRQGTPPVAVVHYEQKRPVPSIYEYVLLGAPALSWRLPPT